MVFLDTNVFIYAHDLRDPQKSKKARELISKLVIEKEACISTQVIQEFCNVVLRKSQTPLKSEDVRTILRELLIPLLAHQPDGEFYAKALETYKKYSLSFYDALIVHAAIDLECEILYSEDLQSGAHYGKVQVINPFQK